MSKPVGIVDKVYVFGNAETSVGFGKTTDLKNPFVSIAKLQTPANYIKEDILNSDIKESEKIILLFKNIQGLEVLEKMVKEARKEFKKQSKLIKST